MQPLTLFVFQLLWFLSAWALLAWFVAWPWSARLSPNARLSGWIAPQMFRVLGVGLLVPNLSPGMPAEFAVPTAAADAVTAVLGASAFLALQRDWSAARGLALACTIVGTLDLLVAFPHAAAVDASAHLAAQWYVPVLVGPVMAISHVACFVLLSRGTKP